MFLHEIWYTPIGSANSLKNCDAYIYIYIYMYIYIYIYIRKVAWCIIKVIVFFSLNEWSK